MSTSTVTPTPQGSNLGQAVSQSASDNINQPVDPSEVSGGGGSRLLSILKAVASVGSTALSGIPDRGRPSFITGLGEGSRAEQASEANQQAIKFRSFDDSVRAASLHNQDQELQLRTQEQNDAHQKAQDAQHDWDEAHGIQYDEVPNTGSAVTDHLTAQTTATGSASIAPGTHLSADGKSILVPKQTTDMQAAQLLKYNTFAPAYGLPSLPQGAQFVPGKYLDMLQNKLEGHSLSGDVYNHDQLPGAIADLQSTRDSLAKSGGSPDVLKQVDGTIASMKSKLDFLDKHAASVADAASARKIAENKAATDERGAQQRETNDAKPQNKGGGNATPDPFGVTSPLDSKQYNSRYNTFSKAYVQPLTKTDQQLSQFASIQSDIDKNGNMTGAESVVGLFNAIGISASPLKGMGFRINNNTVEEHASATGLGQKLYQKVLSLKAGDVVTPQQLKDYASIATQARESQYSSAIDEARRQGLPVDFLPKGNGAQIDPSTAKMYIRAASGDPAKARTAAQAAGWRF